MGLKQGLKLAVIGNACFWLAVFFQYWQGARQIPAILLQTILILGVSAIVVNAGLFGFLFWKKWKGKNKDAFGAKEGLTEKGTWFLHFFNLVSFLAQIIFLISRV